MLIEVIQYTWVVLLEPSARLLTDNELISVDDTRRGVLPAGSSVTTNIERWNTTRVNAGDICARPHIVQTVVSIDQCSVDNSINDPLDRRTNDLLQGVPGLTNNLDGLAPGTSEIILQPVTQRIKDVILNPAHRFTDVVTDPVESRFDNVVPEPCEDWTEDILDDMVESIEDHANDVPGDLDNDTYPVEGGGNNLIPEPGKDRTNDVLEYPNDSIHDGLDDVVPSEPDHGRDAVPRRDDYLVPEPGKDWSKDISDECPYALEHRLEDSSPCPRNHLHDSLPGGDNDSLPEPLEHRSKQMRDNIIDRGEYRLDYVLPSPLDRYLYSLPGGYHDVLPEPHHSGLYRLDALVDNGLSVGLPPSNEQVHCIEDGLPHDSRYNLEVAEGCINEVLKPADVGVCSNETANENRDTRHDCKDRP